MTMTIPQRVAQVAANAESVGRLAEFIQGVRFLMRCGQGSRSHASAVACRRVLPISKRRRLDRARHWQPPIGLLAMPRSSQIAYNIKRHFTPTAGSGEPGSSRSLRSSR
jgi:hypothetical protein